MKKWLGVALVAILVGTFANAKTIPITLFAGCSAGYGTPTLIANPLSVFASGVPFTTTAAAPIGSLIIVAYMHQAIGAQTISAVVDSASNSYSKAVSNTTTSYYGEDIWYATATTALPLGGTITATTTDNLYVQAISVSGGKNIIDKTTSQSSSATSFSLPLTGLACSNEFAFGAMNPSVTLSGYAGTSGFTDFDLVHMPGNGGSAYDIAPNRSVAWNASWTSTASQSSALAVFK
jgi:hypothetical protein